MKSTLFQAKQANPAAIAVNNAGDGHESVPLLCDPTKAPEIKEAAGSNWKRKWPHTEVIQPGTVLYHGTESEFEEGDDLQMPAWFSAEREVAEWFAKRNGTGPGSVRTYKVSKPVELPVILNKKELDDFFEQFSIEAYSAEDMADGVVRAGLPGWIIPENYNPGNDILIADGSAVQLQNIEPSRKASAKAGEGDKIVRQMKQLGWERPGRAGASVTDFKNPAGEDEIWVDWDEWRHMLRTSSGWQELAKGTTLRELQMELKRKISRQIMHDDSGATTGLRSQPDYGESDSYTSKMNDANSKGAAAGFLVQVSNVEGVKEAATKIPLYIASVDFDSFDTLKVAKFTFSASREKAMVLPNLLAHDIARQITGPEFGVQATVTAAAVDYGRMFGAFQSLVPKKYDRNIQSEIDWAKGKLKKQDRIIWYLRIFRLGLVRHAGFEAHEMELLNEQKQQKAVPAQVQQPIQAAAPAAVPQQQTLAPAAQPQQPVAPLRQLTLSERLGKLRDKYANEMKAKGVPSDGLSPDLDFLPNMKGNLEHFYSLPIPTIQNTVLGGQSYTDLISSFRQAEEEWQEKAVRLVRPVEGDKVWMQFPNGWAWWWLPRAACDIEAKAMGHCGNRPRADRSDQTILSLREPVQYGGETLWEPHLTFVLHNSGQGDNGTLGEMKGRNNDKPAPQYHSYVVALLKDRRIHGFVGATWMKSHNFTMGDLTEAQREEIYAANPNLQAGGILRDWKKNGMDSVLVNRIKSVLQIDEDVEYNEEYKGLVIRKWADKAAFVEACGDSDAKEAWRTIAGNKKLEPLQAPNDDTLVEFAMDYGSEKVIGNIGQSLANEFPKEAKEWFSDARGEAWQDGGWDEGDYGFDPSDKDQVKRFLELLREPYYTGEKAEWPTEPRRHKDKDEPHGDPKDYKYRKISTLESIKYAYSWGMPNHDDIRETVRDAIEHAMRRQKDGTKIEESNETGELLQLMPEKEAVALAEQVATDQSEPDSIDSPDITVASNWNEWNDEQATEGLNDQFQKPLTFKTPVDKNQKRLFREPKTVEEAQEKGIPITHNSSLKSPLWWA